MAVVTTDLLVGITTNFRVLFFDSLADARARQVRGRLAFEVDSNAAQETYNWLGNVPKMREWISDRQLSGLLAHDYTIKNRHFEATLEVDRDIIEDDRLGLIKPRIQQLSDEAVRFEDELTFQALLNGHQTLGYDGQFFFDTDHAEGSSGTQSNLITGTGTTLAQVTADYQTARARVRTFKDDKGRPMNVNPTTIVAPPELEGVFLQLLSAEMVPATAGTVQNIWKGTAELIVSPYLTDPNDWYLLSLDKPIKPLIFQNRRAPDFQALDNPRDEQAFMRRMYYYGVDARYNVGYALWQLAAKVTNV